jgi:hypothetical protein
MSRSVRAKRSCCFVSLPQQSSLHQGGRYVRQTRHRTPTDPGTPHPTAPGTARPARRAEVGKTTVYRRWGSVTGLVADLLADMAAQPVPRTQTGSVLGDLRAHASLVQRTLADPRHGALLRAVIAAAACDERTAEALRRFSDVRVAEWAPCVQQGLARGELPPGTELPEKLSEGC